MYNEDNPHPTGSWLGLNISVHGKCLEYKLKKQFSLLLLYWERVFEFCLQDTLGKATPLSCGTF